MKLKRYLISILCFLQTILISASFAQEKTISSENTLIEQNTDQAFKLMEAEKFSEARDLFTNVISEVSKSGDSSKELIDSIKIFSAICLFKTGNKQAFIDEAKSLIDQGASAPEHNYALKTTLGHALVSEGKFDEARQYFIDASKEPLATFNEKTLDRIAGANCLFLAGKKDKFLAESESLINQLNAESKDKFDSSSVNVLNGLRMTVGDVLHNDGEWKKAREVYLQISDDDVNRYINARARAAQSLYYEGDLCQF